jgi:dTDP-4-dehydrorhamnose reductase
MRALVLGADSGIGEALGEALAQRGDRVYGTTRRQERVAEDVLYLDLDQPESAVSSWPEVDVAFICAAVTRFSDCRIQPERARRVNVTTPVAMSAHLAERGTRIIFLSTSAVLDCRAPRMQAIRSRAPTSAYGRLKAEAEAALLAIGPPATVLRLTKVLTPGMKLFADWIDALIHGNPVRAFSDLRFSPIALEHVVQALLVIADHRQAGIFQVSGASDISYADAAFHIARRLGVSDHLVEVCSAIDHGIPPEEITAYTSLETDRLAVLSGFVPPEPWPMIDAAIASLLDPARPPTRIA